MKFSKAFSIRFFLVLVLLVTIVSLTISTGVWAQSNTTPTSTSSPAASAAASPSSTLTTPTLRVAFGQVISIASDNTSFDIQKEDLSPMTITVDSNTRYSVITIPAIVFSILTSDVENIMEWWDMSNMYGMSNTPGMGGMDGMPGMMNDFTQTGSFSNIAVGDLVIVKRLLSTGAARQIDIIKFTDNIKFVQGKVTSVGTDSVTITPNTGSAITLGWDSNSRFLLGGAISIQPDQTIEAIYDNNAKLFKLAMVETPAATATPLASPTTTMTPSPSP